MARTDGLFEIRQTGYVSPIDGASLWMRGTDNYINFGLTPGSAGYGFRDNSGVMEFKDAGGSWAAFGSGGGGIPAGSDSEIQYNDSGVFGADSLFKFDKTYKSLILGTPVNAASSASRLNAVSSTSYITGTGTISFSGFTVVGTGTAFLTQLVVGSTIRFSAFGAPRGYTIVRIVSNTLAYILSDIFSGFGPVAFEYSKPIMNIAGPSDMAFAVSDKSGTNPLTGATDLSTTIAKGNFFVGNTTNPQSGLLVYSFANDGRMALGHSASLASYILFYGGNSNLVLVNAGTSNLFAGAHTYLGRENPAGNQTYLDVYSSGTGANQTIYMHAMRFAINNDAPKIQQASNGYDLGIRNGSLHSEGIDNIIFSMGKTNGNISLGLFGTSTPTEATTRLDFATVGETMGFKTGTNATIGTATLAAGTITISTTAITANSMIVLSVPRGTVTNLGALYESARTAGTSFTITSANILDTATFDWHLIEKL